jgi:hypothetical protein
MKRICSLFAALCLLLLLTVTAFGDMGPKAQLTVRVKYPPKEAYYLDLLYEGEDDDLHDNLGDDRARLDESLLEKMENARPEGWCLALVDGTMAPCWGDPAGEVQSDGTVTHTFSYFGVPDTYRIQLVTASGDVYQSETYTRHVLQSTVTLDWETGQVTAPSSVGAYALQFLSTCLPTLVIEGLLLLAFGYRFKENWKLFLTVNILTQLLLTAVLGTALITGGPTFVYALYLPLEAGIMALEALIYWKFLTGRSKKRAVCYAVAANAASYLAGAMLASYQFHLICNTLK